MSDKSLQDAIREMQSLDPFEDWFEKNRKSRPDTVQCDDDCGALANPQTIEQYRATLDHWETHSYLCGCSHGC